MTRVFFPLALCATLSACGSKIGVEDTDGATEGSGDAGSGGEAGSGEGDGSGGDFSPEEGHYSLVTAVQSDSCGLSGGATEGTGGFTLTHDSGATWTLQTDTTATDTGTTGGSSTTCTLSDKDLGCEPIVTETPFTDLGMDVTLVLSMNLSATFLSASEAGGVASYEASCTGADCASLSAFGFVLPCSYVLDFTATAD